MGGSVRYDEGIVVETGADGIAVVTFDQPNSGANVLNQATIARLGTIVDGFAGDPGLKGVVFISAKKSVFIAGADIKEFRADMTPAEVEALIRRGQDVFSKVAALRVPTVAAIHGACMGGGCELSLACSIRIASDDPATKIGLPETMLGIVPAWGGCARLPRLVGLPKALGAIAAGDRMAARKALKLGLVDRVVPREHLLRVATQLIAKGAPARKGHALTNNALAAGIIASQAKKAVLAKTGGHYPAPIKAIDVCAKGVSGSVDDALRLEREAIAELVKSDVSRNLVGVFFLQERAKKFEVVPGAAPAPVGRIAVVGAGIMGGGIAQWAAARGHEVVLKDLDHAAIGRGIKAIAALFEGPVKRKSLDKTEARRALDRIHPAVGDVPLGQVDLVIEAAAERLDIKRRLFADLEARTRPDAILATNTSSLPIADIAAGMAHPERVVGIHFFNPVHRMQLVEVIHGPQTAPEVTDRAVRWVQAIGKLPVVVKDSPGFLVNRILLPYLIEAGLLFAGGARIEDLDRAIERFGMPMGPMRLMDEVGLDVGKHAAAGMAAAFAGRMPELSVLDAFLEKGWLGRKSGKGFYSYDGGKGKRPEVNAGAVALTRAAGGSGAAGLRAEAIVDRLVLPMLNEAARCLEERLVAGPEDVDLGMIMGTGFAPFRGGPCRYADTLGAAEVVRRLEALAAEVGPRYAPCTLLKEMAANGGSFYAGAGARTATAALATV